jgi:phosphate uptake regulator
MDTQQHIQFLRLHLLDMAKLSQRAVDYATKGYRLGSPEFCRYVRRGDKQLGELRRSISNLCQKLMMQDFSFDSDARMEELATTEKRFPVSALHICSALHAISTATAEIAHHTMLLLEDADWVPGHEALQKVCYLVNRFMCLCIVALFKREGHHAQTVLQNLDGGRLFEQAFDELRNDINRQAAIPAALELAIANSLKQIARQTQGVAEAIVFWLDGKKCALTSAAIAH